MEYENMTVAQLKELLREANLPVSGNKSALIERLSENNTPVESSVEVSVEEEVEDFDDTFDEEDDFFHFVRKIGENTFLAWEEVDTIDQAVRDLRNP